jgi:hypothetical protein
MKIRFKSDKERDPTNEAGLKVLYAPGKRVAFRLRWYLILLLIGSPFLWLFGRLALGVMRIEAPAQIQMPVTELRAREAGQVANVLVQTGDQVILMQPLLRLDNQDWRLRLKQLQPNGVSASVSLGQQRQRLQQQAIDRAGDRVSQLRQLLAERAATRAELLAAEAHLNSERQRLLEIQERQRRESEQREGDLNLRRRDEQERLWLQARLDAMEFFAPHDARVAEVLVNEGENVGPGTVLLRLERNADPLLLIYVEPRHAAYATPGTIVQVSMPDGGWRQARVLHAADSARRLPAGMQRPFSTNQLGLLVPAEFIESLPPLWRVDRLPLQVRFGWRWPVGFESSSIPR